MANPTGYNKIVLRGSYTEGGAEHEEGILDAAATPGMNLVLSAMAEQQQRQHYTPGSTDYVGTGTSITTTKNPVKILKEDALRGLTIDDAYAAEDNCFLHICKSGEIILVLVASGQTVNKTDGLSAASTGKWATDTTNAAVEALEGSGGSLSEDTHLRVRVL